MSLISTSSFSWTLRWLSVRTVPVLLSSCTCGSGFPILTTPFAKLGALVASSLEFVARGPFEDESLWRTTQHWLPGFVKKKPLPSGIWISKRFERLSEVKLCSRKQRNHVGLKIHCETDGLIYIRIDSGLLHIWNLLVTGKLKFCVQESATPVLMLYRNGAEFAYRTARVNIPLHHLSEAEQRSQGSQNNETNRARHLVTKHSPVLEVEHHNCHWCGQSQQDDNHSKILACKRQICTGTVVSANSKGKNARSAVSCLIRTHWIRIQG